MIAKLAAGILLVALTAAGAIAQPACRRLVPGRTGLVYGKNHSFIVQAPAGWVGALVQRFPVAFH